MWVSRVWREDADVMGSGRADMHLGQIFDLHWVSPLRERLEDLSYLLTTVDRTEASYKHWNVMRSHSWHRAPEVYITPPEATPRLNPINLCSITSCSTGREAGLLRFHTTEGQQIQIHCHHHGIYEDWRCITSILFLRNNKWYEWIRRTGKGWRMGFLGWRHVGLCKDRRKGTSSILRCKHLRNWFSRSRRSQKFGKKAHIRAQWLTTY